MVPPVCRRYSLKTPSITVPGDGRGLRAQVLVTLAVAAEPPERVVRVRRPTIPLSASGAAGDERRADADIDQAETFAMGFGASHSGSIVYARRPRRRHRPPAQPADQRGSSVD